jgi:hypothetical protein
MPEFAFGLLDLRSFVFRVGDYSGDGCSLGYRLFLVLCFWAILDNASGDYRRRVFFFHF